MIDIVIFAVVAVLLFARLWAMLGERREDDPQRPNPFVRSVQPKDEAKDEEDFVIRPDKTREDIALARPSLYAAAPPPKSLAGALDTIQKSDSSFDEKKFVHGAKAAFSMIVAHFAKGDLSRIERILSPSVFAAFKQAVAARRALGHVQETVLTNPPDAEVISAKTEGNNAFITIQFTSRQISVTRDAAGEIVAGSLDQVEEVQDFWTFARDMTSQDPNWQLVETRS